MTRNICIFCLTFAFVLVQVPPKEVNGRERNLIRCSLDRLAQEPIVVKVSVLNEKTHSFVPNLRVEDFMIEEDGEKQKPTRFLRDERPLSILLLIDTSGSMRPIIQSMLEALSTGLKRLKPDDEVALMGFNQEPDILQGFTRDKGLVNEALTRLVAGGKTLTRQALIRAADYMLKATAADSRRVIVVVTDNTSTPESALSEKVVMQQLSASASVVCGIIISNPRPNPSPTPILGPYPPTAPAGGRPDPAPLRKPAGDITPYVDETGGIVEKEVKAKDVTASLVTTIDAFRNYYWIEYLSTNSKRDGKHRKIKVTLAPEVKKTGGKLTVLAQRGYYAPPNTASGDRK